MFGKATKNADGLNNRCRPCANVQLRNRELKRRRERLDLILAAKAKQGNRCANTACGRLDTGFTLEFAHFDRSTVLRSASSGKRRGLTNISVPRLRLELTKGRFLCVDCHRQETKWEARAHQAPATPRLTADRRKAQARSDLITSIKLDFSKGFGKCHDCERKVTADKADIFDFDHVDPSTKFEKVSRLLRRSIEVVLAEIARCQLVCVPCHRRRTAQQHAAGLLNTKVFSQRE
jgi:hypothetical protein